MSLGKKRGMFAWYGHVSAHAEQTIEFYKTLMNWTTKEAEMPGVGKSAILSCQGMPFADVNFDVTPASHNQWICYIAVDDVDDFCKLAVNHHGKVIEAPYTIPGLGRTAIVEDPVGALFQPFTPARPENLETSMGKDEGFICWNELMTSEPEKAVEFYAKTVGWTFKKIDMGPRGPSYGFETANGQPAGAIVKTSGHASGRPPQWMPYLTVRDVEAKLRQANVLGARILMHKTAVPETGYCALMQDPAGALTYLFQFDRDLMIR